MKTRFSKKFPRPFMVSEDQIESFADLLRKQASKLMIETICVDDVKRTFDNVEELLAYENSDQSKITCLTIGAYSGSFDNEEQDGVNAQLEFSLDEKNGLTDTCHISFYIEGPDDKATLLHQKIVERIQGTRPYYSLAAQTSGAFLGTLFTVLYLGASYIWLFTSAIEKNLFDDLDAHGIYSTVVVILFFGLFFLAALAIPTWMIIKKLIHFRRVNFCAGVFLVGQQKRFEKDRDRWRHIITSKVLGYIIAFIFSGIVFWVAPYIGRFLLSPFSE